jgi:oligopeptide transport system ATP-binding protein
MTAPLLEVRDLRKHYPVRTGLFARATNAVRAVDGVSFALAPGETLGLVGESGCGKSTLVKTLLFLEQPTGGEIRFAGEAVTTADADRLRRNVQIVFQDPYTSLPPRMRVADIIADPLRIHRIGDRASAERRVRHLMREVGLNPERGRDYRSGSASPAPSRSSRHCFSSTRRCRRSTSRCRRRCSICSRTCRSGTD